MKLRVSLSLPGLLLSALGCISCSAPIDHPPFGGTSSESPTLKKGMGTRATRPSEPTAPEAAVRAVLNQQVADWNRGSIDDFMRGYAHSGSTRFASGGDVTLGWDTVRDRYLKRYGNAAKMGRLTFSDIEVNELSPGAAVAFGHWRLERTNDVPSGLFTLVFRRGPEGWKIVHDHTSAATP